jgi:hypothetical protein
MEKSCVTPEEAALAGFPAGQARVVRTRTGAHGADCSLILGEDEVEVELATNEPPYEYTYFVHVERRHERWFEGVSHN